MSRYDSVKAKVFSRLRILAQTRLIFQLSLLFYVLAASAQGIAADTPQVQLPERLFRWMSPEGLRRLADRMKVDGRVPLKTIASTGEIEALAYFRPEFRGRDALFLWSHPFTGMGAGKGEWYARPGNGGREPARVLMLEPMKDSVTAVLISQMGKEPIQGGTDLSGIDFVYHVVLDQGGNEFIKEWVLLNPEKVRSFTADPEIIKPILKKELDKMSDPLFRFSNSDLHVIDSYMNSQEGRRAIKDTAESYLNASSDNIPKAFLGGLRPDDHGSGCVSRQLGSLLRSSGS